MGILKTHTGSESFSSLQIQKAVTALVITVDGKLSGNERISVQKVSAGGTSDQDGYNKIPVKAIIELYAKTQGYYRENETQTQIIIPIASGGALVLGNDGYLNVDMEGLTSARTYTIEGMESPSDTVEMIQFDRKSVLASSEGIANLKLPIGGYNVILLPIQNLTEIKLSYANGKSPEYSVAMLKAIADSTNDLIKVAETPITLASIPNASGSFADESEVIAYINMEQNPAINARLAQIESAIGINKYGYGEYLVFNIEQALTIDIETNGTAYTFYTIKR